MPAWRASGPLLRRHNIATEPVPCGPNAAGVKASCRTPSLGSGSLSRRSRAYDADLRDSASVNRCDLKPVALDLDRVAHSCEPAETAEHQTAHGVVRLVRQLHTQPLAQRVERREAIDDERPRTFFLERRHFDIELVVDLADELLDHVLEGHQTGRTAELIEDDRELHALTPELRQSLIQTHGLGHHRDFPHHVPRTRPLLLVDADQILDVDDSDDVVEVL